MGIDGLYPYIHSKAEGCAKDCKLTDFKGKKIVFDGNSFVYKFRYGNRPNTHILEFGRLFVEQKSTITFSLYQFRSWNRSDIYI